jgi:hypothetical protein
VPRRASQLTVGGRTEADVLLHLDNVPNRGVLGCAEFSWVDQAGSVVVSCAKQLGWTQQAADMVGSERWNVASCHTRFYGR